MKYILVSMFCLLHFGATAEMDDHDFTPTEDRTSVLNQCAQFVGEYFCEQSTGQGESSVNEMFVVTHHETKTPDEDIDRSLFFYFGIQNKTDTGGKIYPANMNTMFISYKRSAHEKLITHEVLNCDPHHLSVTQSEKNFRKNLKLNKLRPKVTAAYSKSSVQFSIVQLLTGELAGMYEITYRHKNGDNLNKTATQSVEKICKKVK